MFKSLSGKRTYVVALALGILTVLHSLGYVDGNVYNTLVGLFGAGGLAALRAATPKV